MNPFFYLLAFTIFGIVTINWAIFNPNEAQYYVDFIPNSLTNITDEKFTHNFCESRLQNNQGPEHWNAWSSLIITTVPLVLGFPRYNLLYNVACLLAVNGIASFHYHYHLSWVGKQADEIAMILANYFGQWALINMYYRSEQQNSMNRYNTVFMYLFLVFNTLTKYDFLFPSIFGIYVGSTLIMIHRVSKKYKVPYIQNLAISFVGATCWIISEHHCNEYTKFGHVVWHSFFPLGFYKLILDFDNAKTYFRFHRNNLNTATRIRSRTNDFIL